MRRLGVAHSTRDGAMKSRDSPIQSSNRCLSSTKFFARKSATKGLAVCTLLMEPLVEFMRSMVAGKGMAVRGSANVTCL
jgi:hypothetical protein